MEVMSAIKERRSIRKYLPDNIPQNVLSQIIEAGSYAPSGGNNKTCHFIVIQDRDIIKKIVRAAANEFAKLEITEGMYKSFAAAIKRAKENKEKYDFTYGAPVFVIIANKRGYMNAMADSVLAAENMFLQATALGVGSCYINQVHWMTENENVLEELYSIGLEKDEYVCLSAVFGYTDAKTAISPRRLGNKVTWIP